MKKTLTTAFVFLIIATVFAQNFEGKITYQNAYKSKTPGLTDEQFNSMMGTIQDYYIKGGDYKSVTNGALMQWQLYINKDNKLYNKMSNSETIFWNDGAVNDDSVIAFKLNKNVTEILGYKCDELILTCKNGTEKYYFNSKLGVDKNLYNNHKYGNWYYYLKLANALPLKIIIDKVNIGLESTATEVKAMKFDNKQFQLPENIKTAKNPY